VSRAEFEHVVRAAAAVVRDEIVVVGSQAVLGQFPDAPAALLRSLEADVYPRGEPDRAIEIDGAIGDGSPFHETYGYYAHGVGPETAKAPAGWQDRLVRVDLPGTLPSDPPVTAWCLEIHDLVLSKLAAGRPRDYDYAREAVRNRLAKPETLRDLAQLMPARDRERLDRAISGLAATMEA
jgi:hypothetical protein